MSFVKYDEIVEDGGETIRNLLKFSDTKLTVIRHGAVESSMSFEKGKKLRSLYRTPFGDLEVGTLVSPEDEDAFCAAILEELTRRHAEPERRDAIAHYARGNFAQAQFVARLEEVYQSAVRDFQIRGGQAV